MPRVILRIAIKLSLRAQLRGAVSTLSLRGAKRRGNLVPRGTFPKRTHALTALLLLLPLTTTQAAELLNVTVKETGGRYTVTSESSYTATPEALFAVLLDYENFNEVSSVFTKSHYLDAAEDGRPRAYTMMEGCVIFFCTSIERIDRLTVTPYTEIIAESEPNPADFRYSRSRWRFETKGDTTRIHYQMEMEPGFWVPPIVGPYFLKHRLKSGAADAVERVEALALGETVVE